MFLQHLQVGSRQQNVIRPGFWHLSTATCSVIVSAGTTVLIARELKPDGFGIYMFVLWLATAAVPAIGVGMSSVTSRYLAEVQAPEEPRLAVGIFHFVWQRQYRNILLYCGIYILLALPLSWYFGANAPILLLLLAGLSAPPLLLSGVAGIALRSLHRFDLLAIIHLFGAVFTLFLMIIATQFEGEQQIGIFLLAAAIASILTLVMALICIVRLMPLRQAMPPGTLLKDRLTRGLSNSLVLFTLDVIVWQRSEVLWLTHGHSAAELGFYALSAMISASMLEISPALLATCVLPLLLRYIPGQHYRSASDAFVKTSVYVALLAMPLCTAAIVFCPTLVALCFGADYQPIVMPLRILLVAAAFGSVSTISLTHLANGDRRRAQVWLGSGAALLNILLALPLIAFWGVSGAALASAISQIISATGSILICSKMMFGIRRTR